jgi:hypothetical protein
VPIPSGPNESAAHPISATGGRHTKMRWGSLVSSGDSDYWMCSICCHGRERLGLAPFRLRTAYFALSTFMT